MVYAGATLTDEPGIVERPSRNTGSATKEMYETFNILEQSSNPTAARVHRITADSEFEPNPAEFAMDGDIETFWRSEWRDEASEPTHWLVLEFKQALMITRLQYLPRQDRSNGRIKDCAVEVSENGQLWRPVTDGTFKASQDWQTIEFDRAVKAAWVRLKVLPENAQQGVAIAEIQVIEKE